MGSCIERVGGRGRFILFLVVRFWKFTVLIKYVFIL